MTVEGDNMVGIAKKWLGTPYESGADERGSGGGVDCSHLVHAVYKEAKYDYPYVDTSRFPPPGYFQAIATADTTNGDVVLFSGHMGIYVSADDGRTLISAEGTSVDPKDVRFGKPVWFGAIKGVFRWAR